MPFLLYDTAVTAAGKKRYNQLNTVPIAGKWGPLAALHAKKNPRNKVPFGWHATAAEIVEELKGSDNQEVLINLKPNGQNNVSLYRLLDVWGFSYTDWTPLALRLEVLFADHRHKSPEKFMKSFQLENQKSGEYIGEFLYLKGGVAGGTWSWGQVGRVNGALLWKDAFTYLSSNLKRSLT
jgi:hypothetical protein